MQAALAWAEAQVAAVRDDPAARLALGRFAPLGHVLGDPRLGMAGAFLSLRRVLPDRYRSTWTCSATSTTSSGAAGCSITR